MPFRIKISAKQWQRLIERLLARGEELTPEVAESLLKHQPLKSTSYGVLEDLSASKSTPPEIGQMYQTLIKGGEVNKLAPYKKIFPYEQAKSIYEQFPERYRPVRTSAPEVNRIFHTPPGSPEEIARGLGAETMQFKPIVSARIDSMFRKQMLEHPQTSLAEEPTLRRASGEIIKVPTMPKGEAPKLLDAIRTSDYLWKKVLGGKRGMGGKLWINIFDRAKYRRGYSSARDYFDAMWIKFSAKPKAFKKTFPREYNFLSALEGVFKEGPEQAQEASKNFGLRMKGRVAGLLPLTLAPSIGGQR